MLQLGLAGNPLIPHPSWLSAATTAHRWLRVCQAQLHLQDLLRAQAQMGTKQGHKDWVVPLVLWGRSCWQEGGCGLPVLTPSQGSGLFPFAHHLPQAGVPLTVALGGPGSGVPFSSSSWTAVARIGTLWGEAQSGGVGRAGALGRVEHPWAQVSPGGPFSSLVVQL